MDDGQGRAELNPARLEQVCNRHSEAVSSLGRKMFDFEFQGQKQPEYNRIYLSYLQQFRAEYQNIASIIKPSSKRAFMFEIMCSKESELTRQGMQQGLSVKRFGLAEGDLRTKTGRRNLFCHIAKDRPEHIWISPTCSPWCLWSNFNMSRNAELRKSILTQRKENIWQVSLANMLCEHQVMLDRHFHCEQPQGSQLLRLPCFQPIVEVTKPSIFDLCQVGDLREPVTKEPIRKRLVVCTTSKELHTNLNQRICRESHKHHQIAGSTRVNGNKMPLSSFTESELYPRKFARQIIQCLRREKGSPHYVCAAEDEHPTKRRRVSQKMNSTQIQVLTSNPSWEEIMQVVDLEAPRVGIRAITEGYPLEAVQRRCPQQVVHHLVLCRGMDRMVGPNMRITPGRAPLRRFVSIRRRFEDVVAEEQWEPWERLTARQMRRPCAPSRCGLTVFARSKFESEELKEPIKRKQSTDDSSRSSKSLRVQASESEYEGTPEVPLESPPAGSKASAIQPQFEEQPTEMPQGEAIRHEVDLVSDKHGPRMLALRPDERNWILKVHKNMGHPSAAKLKAFCQQLGCQPEIVEALDDLRCSTCVETKSPELAKPSAIHPPLDFGDVVGMDGIKWTNRVGQQFFCYHFVDQGTTFHTAVSAPSHSTTDAIQALTQGWICWAGPPGTLVVDSGTEFGTEGFHGFLQEHDIRLRMIAPAAHWQNARVERHGGILQSILDKMDQEKPINTEEEFQTAISFATQTKNKWSRHKGYPPELLVFGKLSKCPGSVISEGNSASHDLALQESPEGVQFRERLAIRERARKAFSEVDNMQSLRRAMQQRSRPQRSIHLPGDWIMAWRKDNQWFGPLKVVLQEDKNVIWAVQGNKLFRIAPEHVRSLSAVEEVQNLHQSKQVDMPTTLEQIRPGNTRYVSLNSPEIPVPNAARRSSEDLESNREQPDTEPEVSEKINPSQPRSEVDYEPTSPRESEVPETPLEPVGESPENIPVPIEEEDDLVCDAYNLSEDQAWRFEVNIETRDIDMLRNDPDPTAFAFLVSAAKRQRSEVKLSTLTSTERQLFDAAKEKEIQSWLDTQTVCRILRHKIPMQNILTTLSKLSRNLLLQACVSNRWEIGSFDIKTAFLRGRADSRMLGVEPPPELRAKMNLRPNEVRQLLKGAYGLVNAPLLWFRELSKALTELKFQPSPFDPCCFVLFDEQNKMRGFIGVHVDDGLFAGDSIFHEKINELERKFPFGSRKRKQFVFTGLQINQHDDFSIHVDQTQYVKDINPIPIEKDRRKHHEEPINEQERQHFRGLIGSLQYAAVNTRPDLGSRLSVLQGKINNGQTQDLIEGDKLLHDAKVHSAVKCRYQFIPKEDIRFVAFSDASFASERVQSSHQGLMIMTAHQDIGKNKKSVVNPIVWSSKKIQRVAVSTLSAEAMALAGAMDILAWRRLYWGWLMDQTCQWRLGDKTLAKLPQAFSALKDTPELEDPNQSLSENLIKLQVVGKQDSLIATDCQSLYDIVSRTAPPSCQEFRTLLQARFIKEHLATGVAVRWVPSSTQVADCLTKVMDNSTIRELMHIGKYQLNDEEEILKVRSDQKARLRWFRSHEQPPEASFS